MLRPGQSEKAGGAMKLSRREIIGGAALSGAAISGIAATGCSRGDDGQAPAKVDPPQGLTAETVAYAERVLGLSFNPAERELMLESLESTLEELAKIRTNAIPYELPPAHVFSPRLPRRTIKAQKNAKS